MVSWMVIKALYFIKFPLQNEIHVIITSKIFFCIQKLPFLMKFDWNFFHSIRLNEPHLYKRNFELQNDWWPYFPCMKSYAQLAIEKKCAYPNWLENKKKTIWCSVEFKYFFILFKLIFDNIHLQSLIIIHIFCYFFPFSPDHWPAKTSPFWGSLDEYLTSKVNIKFFWIICITLATMDMLLFRNQTAEWCTLQHINKHLGIINV